MRRLGLTRGTLVLLSLVAVTGCQAPGFMGLSGSATTPDTTDESRVVRARFRVLVPQSLATGVWVAPTPPDDATQSGNRYEDRAVVGARVFVDGQPSTNDTTDDMGMASLALVQGRLTPIRAEFNTPSGTVSMTGLVMVPRDAETAPLFSISVASTLVASKLAQRFHYEDLRYLDYPAIRSATYALDQAIRTPDGAYDPRYVPNLSRQWSVLDTAQTLSRLDPLLTRALADVLATRIPTAAPGTASVAATGSREVAAIATASFAIASGSLPATGDSTASATESLVVGNEQYFPADLGTAWTYDLVDAAGKAHGTLTRRIVKVTARETGTLYIGTETGPFLGEGVERRFLMRRAHGKLTLALPFRPPLEYPGVLEDGRGWEAGPNLHAEAHAERDGDSLSWRIDYVRTHEAGADRWSEWFELGVGLSRYQWIEGKTGHRWEARLHRPAPSPSPS